MRKIIAVSLTVLLLACALYSLSFFTKTAVTEYTLHQTGNLLDELSANPQLVSRRQQKGLIKAAINDLEATPTTSVNAARSYQLKAKLFHLLSEVEVWPVKREQYLKQAIYNNYNAVNINHYNLQYWLFELQMQNLVGGHQEELFWSLSNVLTLGKWNYEVLAYASFYCVLTWKKMPKTLKQPCSNALKDVSSDSVQKRKLMFQLQSIYRFDDIVEEMMQ